MIIIGADHAGFDMKFKIIEYLKENSIEYIDVTNYKIDKNDNYAIVAEKISKEVIKNSNNLGIAICGTGIGISIACNKIEGIYAGVCDTKENAVLIKKHNNANVICLPGRKNILEKELREIIKNFIYTDFEGERHLERIEYIKHLESKFGEK